MHKDQNDSRLGKLANASNFDIFILFNTAIHIVAVFYSYSVSEWEFGLYSIIIIVLGIIAWLLLRGYEFPIWLLVLLQIGIIANFAGGFIRFEGHALYWHHLAGMRVDKIVHFYNSAVLAMVITHLYQEAKMRLQPMEGFVIVMVTAGLGTLVEMFEYTAVRLLPSTGVGDYANTVEDLIANLLGAIFGYVVFRMLEAQLGKSAGAST